MDNELTQAIKDFIYNRIDTATTSIITSDTAYTIIAERIDLLDKMIDTLIPDEHKKLLEEYRNSEALQQGILEEAIYRQGIEDGIALKAFFK